MKNSTRIPSFLILITTLFLISTSTIAKGQLSGCRFEATEIEKCLIQQEGSLISPKPCCAALNQAIQVGFNCLCSLITTTSNGPHLSILLSGSLTSGCEISTPPLTLCQGSAPTPVFLPTEPKWPEDQFSPLISSARDLDVIQTQPPPPFSEELYAPFSHSSSCNYPPCLENGEGSSWNWDWLRALNMASSGGNKCSAFISLLIFSMVCGELLLV